jgi:2-iminobutanoate/2-iminopropanoate deaminase
VCEAAGASLADAVRCGIYVTDMQTFAEVNAAYGTYFETEPPARSTIGVASLPLGAQVEIDAIIAVG